MYLPSYPCHEGPNSYELHQIQLKIKKSNSDVCKRIYHVICKKRIGSSLIRIIREIHIDLNICIRFKRIRNYLLKLCKDILNKNSP